MAEDSPIYYVAGSAAQLTADTSDKLLEVATLHLEDMRRTEPDAGWDDSVRQRSHVLNHFVKALPVEAYDPTMLDSIVFQTRAALHYTGSSLAGMVGLGHKDEEKEGEPDQS